MPIAYMMSDIVLSASLYPEAFGRTIPEAQSMGRIVVGTNHGGATETIQDGKTGFLVPVGDADALAHKLDEIIDMPLETRQKIASAAIESVRENFSIQKMRDNRNTRRARKSRHIGKALIFWAQLVVKIRIVVR